MKTGADGEALLRDIPPGAAIMHVWHPYLKTAANEVVRAVTVPRAGAARETVSVDVRTPPDRSEAY